MEVNVEDQNPTEGQIQDTPEGQQTAENSDESQVQDSPPAQVEDQASKLREYEDRLARQEQRAQFLEQSNRLLEESFRRQSAPRQEEASLSPELAELDKTLAPLFEKRLKGQIDPVSTHMAQVLDGQDALRFENFLMRKRPEVLDDEATMNQVFQQVEQVRRQAKEAYGQYLSRVDAYLYAEGLQAHAEKSKARTAKKSTQVKEEAKRQLQTQAIQGGDNKPEAKRVGGADIDAIRRKMMGGEKVTPEERAKFKKHLEGASF